jgi:toxin ParE1/3/4
VEQGAVILEWTDLAIDNLHSLHSYISDHHSQAADEIVARVMRTVELLKDAPGLGRPGRVPTTRELVIPGTPYIAAYQVKHELVRILAVLHGARQWPISFPTR